MLGKSKPRNRFFVGKLMQLKAASVGVSSRSFIITLFCLEILQLPLGINSENNDCDDCNNEGDHIVNDLHWSQMMVPILDIC